MDLRERERERERGGGGSSRRVQISDEDRRAESCLRSSSRAQLRINGSRALVHPRCPSARGERPRQQTGNRGLHPIRSNIQMQQIIARSKRKGMAAFLIARKTG